jgi:hypothetical protein
MIHVLRKCRIVLDVAAEGIAMSKAQPLVASPLKGPLFDFLELDVDMAPNLPAASSLQHLALCIVQPTWLKKEVRDSGAILPR